MRPLRFGIKDAHPAGIDLVTESAYSAVLVPEKWNDVVSALCDTFAADVAHILAWDSRVGKDRLGIISPKGLEVVGDYHAYYGAIDPRLRVTATLPVDSIFVCHEHFDRDYVRRSPFYQEFLIPRAGRYSMGATLMRDESTEFQLGMTRAGKQLQFSAVERELLAGVIPHLRRALSMTISRQVHDVEQGILYGAMENSSFAIICLDTHNKVLLANIRGESLLREKRWLSVRDGKIKAVGIDDDVRLQAALLQVIATGNSCNLELSSSHVRDRCFVSVLAPPEDSPAAMYSEHTVRAVILVSELGQRRLATVRQLIQLFGLSPAEARLVRALAQGESLESYATEAGVRKTTVRTQLQAALDKMNVGSQKDLVRMVLVIPPLSDSHLAGDKRRRRNQPG